MAEQDEGHVVLIPVWRGHVAHHPAGQVFHAGVLAGLAEGLGWDPNSADLLVGTSAGSVAAAALRAGLTPHDMAAMVEGSPLSPKGAALIAPVGDAPPTHPPPARRRLPAWGPAAPRILLSSLPGPLRWPLYVLIAGAQPGVDSHQRVFVAG